MERFSNLAFKPGGVECYAANLLLRCSNVWVRLRCISSSDKIRDFDSRLLANRAALRLRSWSLTHTQGSLFGAQRRRDFLANLPQHPSASCADSSPFRGAFFVPPEGGQGPALGRGLCPALAIGRAIAYNNGKYTLGVGQRRRENG